MQWSFAGMVFTVAICARVEQVCRRRLVSQAERIEERSRAEIIPRVDLGSTFVEKADSGCLILNG